jgi:hypothetical protein
LPATSGLLEAGAVEDHLRLDLVHRQILDRQRVGLELAECFERRVGDLDAVDDRPFVVAVGKVTLGLVGGQVFEEFDRVASLCGAVFSMPPPETLMWVPLLAWLGQTTPIFSMTFSGLPAWSSASGGRRSSVGQRDAAFAGGDGLDLVGVAALGGAGEIGHHARPRPRPWLRPGGR